MTLQEYIRQSYMRPNKPILKTLGASDDLIDYLMETPSNTNFAVIGQFISSEELEGMVNVTLDFNGGTYNGQSTVVIQQEQDALTTVNAWLTQAKTGNAIQSPYGMEPVGFTTVRDSDSSFIDDTEDVITGPTTLYAFYMAREGYHNLVISMNGGAINGKSTSRGAAIDNMDFSAINWYYQNRSVFTIPEGKEWGGLTTVINDESTLINQYSYHILDDAVFYVLWVDAAESSEPSGSSGENETPAPTSYTVRLKEYPNQLEADYPTYVVPAGESISINSQDGYVEGEWGLPMYWYDADDPEQIGLSLYDLSNYTPTKDTLLILRWFDPNKNIWYDGYYAEPVSDNNNGNDNSGDLSPTFDDLDNPE